MSNTIEDRLEQTPEGYWVVKGETHLNGWVRQSHRLDHDYGVLNRLCSYISPGSLVIDVGANIGTHTCRYLQVAGMVVAYEPHPVHFACLIRNCPAAFSFNSAVSDKQSSAFLHEEQGNTGASYLTEKPTDCEVKTTSLDHGFAENPDWLPVSFLKIDVEGCEPEVLWGAEHLIAQFRPTMYIEINNGALRRRGRTSHNVQEFLTKTHYKWDFIWGGNWDSPQTDLLCTPL